MAHEEREFTLSTGTVLALFFGLALICAVFFGFGYSMGHKSAAAAAAALPADTSGDGGSSSVADNSPSTKPSAASPAIQAIPGYQGSQKTGDAPIRTVVPPVKTTTAMNGATSVTVPMDGGVAAAPKAKKPAPVDPDGQVVGDTSKPALTRPVLATATAVPAQSSVVPVAGTGTVYVQISAVSHKEDADTLVAALRRRGYSVFTRTSDADKLIHVQVGPYASKKDAEVMRQKLMGDGYNAILK